MSIALIHIHWNNLTRGRTRDEAAGHLSLHHGKSAKNQQMETDGDVWSGSPWREVRPAVLGNRGKTGKNAKKGTATPVLPGIRAAYYLGKVRDSLGNGAMEKGASASALSSTSGDEIVGRRSFHLNLTIPRSIRHNVSNVLLLTQYSYTTFMGQSQAASGCVMPGKQAKSF